MKYGFFTVDIAWCYTFDSLNFLDHDINPHEWTKMDVELVITITELTAKMP